MNPFCLALKSIIDIRRPFLLIYTSMKGVILFMKLIGIVKEKLTLKSVLILVAFGMLAVYLCVFIYLNLFQYTQHVDSDIAAEAILAKEMWVDKSITPDDWISSTERRIISTSMVGAVVYGITGSMVTAMGVASIFFGTLVIASFLYLLRTIKLSPLAIITTLLALCCIPINGIKVNGQIVPYFTYLVFLFAGYYAPHIVLMLFSLGAYFRLLQGKKTIRLYLFTGFLVIYALAMGASGMRSLEVVILPLLILEIIALYKATNHFTKMEDKSRWVATAFVSGLTVFTFLGMLYPSSVNYQMTLLGNDTVIEKLFSDCPQAILTCLGIVGNTNLKSLGSVMQLMIYGILAGVVWGIYIIFKNRKSISRESVRTVLYFAYSLLLTVFVISITSTAADQNYFFIVIFLVATIIGVMVHIFERESVFLCTVLVSFVCLFGILNLNYTYKNAIVTQTNLEEYEEIADFLLENDYEYAYAQFWDANRITAITDGEVTVGNILDTVQNLNAYWWLTSTKWYVPNLPIEMPTAYIISNDKEAEFLQGLSSHPRIDVAYKTENYVIYISPVNYVKLQ